MLMELRHEIEIAAPAEIVWGLTVDVERWPDTMPTITSVERLDEGPLRPGSTARIRQPGLGPKVWTVAEVDAPRRFVWGTRVYGVRMDAIHEIVPTVDGCRNVLVLALSGRGAGLLGRLAGRKLRETLATENGVFRAEAERATAPTV